MYCFTKQKQKKVIIENSPGASGMQKGRGRFFFAHYYFLSSPCSCCHAPILTFMAPPNALTDHLLLWQFCTNEASDRHILMVITHVPFEYFLLLKEQAKLRICYLEEIPNIFKVL